GSGGYAQASERLAHTYDLLGRYHESTGDREAAFSDYKNVCQLRVEQNKIPPDNALFGVVRLLRERSSELPLEERVKMWELNTYHRLRPRNSSGFYEKESQQLACEIALLEEQRAAGGFAEQTALHRRVAAVVYTVEEPSETSIGLLNLLNDEKEQKPATSEGQQPSAAEDLQRVNEIATFLGKGGKDHLSDNFRYNDPLSLYKREKLQGSYVAIDHLRQGLQESGTIHPEAAIRTSHAAVRVMVKRPFGERVIGADEPAFIAGLYRYKQSPDDESAAPIIPKPVETVPIDQARIQLDEAFARQLGLPVDPTVQETLLAFPESFHLSKQDIQVAEGVAFIPVVRAPGSWVEQPKFHLMLTTGSDARTLVFKEGKCIGSFITTSDHPTIALEESKQGSGTSFLWEPNLPSSMSAEERKKHGGDLVGTLQLITMPIVIDKGRDGGGKTSIVPVPSEGPKLLPVETHFASREGEDSLLTWRAMIAAVMAGMKEGSVAKPSLKMVESTASRLYSSDSFSSFTRGAVYSSPLRFSGVLASPPLGPMKPSRPARAERREATLATERVAIGTSRTQGSGYGTFTDEIRPDTTKPVSLMRISLIGVSPENMDEIEVK
ncbi:hypothetical protein HY468_01095, partial [Candidatus Roizmanbacteria bacterium]|nr:hypothetical protein [Candidatus Roizmanbacteria bacterium]